MQKIRRHQQLQAQLPRQLHIRHVLLPPVFEIVVEVFAHFLQHDAVDGAERAARFEGFGETAWFRCQLASLNMNQLVC